MQNPEHSTHSIHPLHAIASLRKPQRDQRSRHSFATRPVAMIVLAWTLALGHPGSAQPPTASSMEQERSSLLLQGPSSENWSGFGAAAVDRNTGRRTPLEAGTGSRHRALRTGAAPTPVERPHGLHGSAQHLTKLIKVWCDLDESIMDALSNPADELIIEVRGICDENVTIRRDRVTLRGEDPFNDGIRPIDTQDPRESALFVRSARRIHLENLSLSGADWDGLRISDSTDAITATNLRLHGNGVRGATVLDSIVTFTDVVATGNGFGEGGGRGGFLASGSSYLICNECSATGNLVEEGVEYGAIALQGASVFLGESTTTGTIAVMAVRNSIVSVRGGVLSATHTAADITGYSKVTLNRLAYQGALYVAGNSRANLIGAKQSESQVPNLVGYNSSLRLAPSTFENEDLPGFLVEPVELYGFSNATFEDGAELPSVQCTDGSDAICRPGTLIQESTCGSCTLPANDEGP